MTHPHTGRYVRRIPHFEPPAQEPPAPKHCGRRRSHVVPRATPHSGRSGRPAVQDPLAPAAHTAYADPDAHRFAESAVRLILEVVDGRRPVGQLTSVLDPALVATIVAARTSRTGSVATAVLLRARIRAVDARTAELFGTYARGPRVFAVAGRIVRATSRARAPHGWTITTLWLG